MKEFHWVYLDMFLGTKVVKKPPRQRDIWPRAEPGKSLETEQRNCIMFVSYCLLGAWSCEQSLAMKKSLSPGTKGGCTAIQRVFCRRELDILQESSISSDQALISSSMGPVIWAAVCFSQVQKQPVSHSSLLFLPPYKGIIRESCWHPAVENSSFHQPANWWEAGRGIFLWWEPSYSREFNSKGVPGEGDILSRLASNKYWILSIFLL